jgi:hypothetical protein
LGELTSPIRVSLNPFIEVMPSKPKHLLKVTSLLNTITFGVAFQQEFGREKTIFTP